MKSTWEGHLAFSNHLLNVPLAVHINLTLITMSLSKNMEAQKDVVLNITEGEKPPTVKPMKSLFLDGWKSTRLVVISKDMHVRKEGENLVSICGFLNYQKVLVAAIVFTVNIGRNSEPTEEMMTVIRYYMGIHFVRITQDVVRSADVVIRAQNEDTLKKGSLMNKPVSVNLYYNAFFMADLNEGALVLTPAKAEKLWEKSRFIHFSMAEIPNGTTRPASQKPKVIFRSNEIPVGMKWHPMTNAHFFKSRKDHELVIKLSLDREVLHKHDMKFWSVHEVVQLIQHRPTISYVTGDARKLPSYLLRIDHSAGVNRFLDAAIVGPVPYRANNQRNYLVRDMTRGIVEELNPLRRLLVPAFLLIAVILALIFNHHFLNYAM